MPAAPDTLDGRDRRFVARHATMSRRHFRWLAAIVGESVGDAETRAVIVDALCDWLPRENRAFSPDRFRAAVERAAHAVGYLDRA